MEYGDHEARNAEQSKHHKHRCGLVAVSFRDLARARRDEPCGLHARAAPVSGTATRGICRLAGVR